METFCLPAISAILAGVDTRIKEILYGENMESDKSYQKTYIC